MSETKILPPKGRTPGTSVPESPWFDWLAVLKARAPLRQVLDIGACHGGWFPTWFELGAERIVAAEPIPECYRQICTAYGNDPHITTLHLAVSDMPGELRNVNVHNCWTLEPEHGNKLDRALEFRDKPAFDVELDTVDAICERTNLAPDFIKIDTDGYDARVMRGARSALAKRPIIMIEVSYLPSVIGDCCECMVRDFFELGYRAQSVVTGEIFNDARALMRKYPWDTSWDVLLLPR